MLRGGAPELRGHVRDPDAGDQGLRCGDNGPAEV